MSEVRTPHATSKPRLTFREYQRSALKTRIYPRIGHNVVYPTLGALGELGEFANKLKKVFRDNDGWIPHELQDEFASELGDVLWYLAMIAHEMGIDFENMAMDNLAKLHDRQRRGTLRGRGDNR